MLKSFDRYILKEIASPFGIGLLIYTMTLLLNTILMLSERLISKDVSGEILLKMLSYLIPDLLAFTLPMSILMGVLAGLSRMSADSEIVALKTMGVDNFRLLRPIMAFAFVGWILSSWMIMYLAPEANYRFNDLNTRVILSKSVSDIKSRVVNRDFHPFTIYFDDIDNKTDEWKNVFLYSRQGEGDTIILAERGKFIQDTRENVRHILLKNANMHTFNDRDPDRKYELTHYAKAKENLPGDMEIKQSRRSTQLIFPALVEKMQEEPENVLFAIEFHRKFALPFACLALGFLALSLGVSTRKGGKVSGFIISLAIIFIYYGIITAGQNMVMKGIVPPFIGIWAADIFLLVSGLVAYYLSSREKTINWERLAIWAAGFRRRFQPAAHGHVSAAARKEPRVVMVLKVPRLSIPFFKILDIYILKRIVITFLFIILSITVVFYIVTIMELLDNVIENNIPISFLLNYIWFYTPEMLKFVIPVSILTSVLLTFSIMGKNNELTAVQVSGISLYRLTIPAILLGLLLSVGYFFIQETLAPEANRKARKILDVIFKHETPEEHEFQKNWVMGTTKDFYFYDQFNPRKNRYLNFNVVRITEDFTLQKRIQARSAFWLNDSELQLESGYMRNFEGNQPREYQSFSRTRITINEGRELFTRKIKDYVYMNIAELREYINYLKDNQSDAMRYEAQLQNRYAFPLSSLVMVLIAIPFSMMMGKRGALYGIGLAIGISLVFWGIFGIFTAMGSTAILPPMLSAFAPIVLFSGFSLYMFINIKT